jgi:hypothetical protein
VTHPGYCEQLQLLTIVVVYGYQLRECVVKSCASLIEPRQIDSYRGLTLCLRC